MEFTPKYIKQTISKRDKDIVTSQEWNAILNLLIQQGDHNSLFLTQIASDCTTFEEVANMISEKMKEIGAADMAKSVYDPDGNGIVKMADTVVNNSIETKHIKNKTITTEKLDEALIKKLNYAYNNVSKLLILMGGQGEIEGSADLVLFGLDGELESVYNADSETARKALLPTTIAAGTTSITHDQLDITDTIKTNKNYTITDNKNVNRSILSSVTNAVRTVSSGTQTFGIPYKDDSSLNIAVAHVANEYFCIVSAEAYASIMAYLVKHNSDNTLTIVTSKEVSEGHRGEYYSSGYVVKRGDNVYIVYDDHYMYRVTTSGITNLSKYTGRQHVRYYAYSVNGNIYSTQDNGSSSDTKYLNCNSWVHKEFADSDIDLYQVTGEWAILRVKPDNSDNYDENWTYYSLNLKTGTLTVSENARTFFKNHYLNSSSQKDIITSPDGVHYFCKDGKYKLNSDFTEVKVATILDLPTKFIMVNNDILVDNSENSDTNTHNKINFDVYKIYPDNICRKVYSLNDQKNSVQYDATNKYLLRDIAVSNDLTKGVLGYQYTAVRGVDPIVKTFSFTPGTIKLSTGITKALSGQCFVCRQQVAIIPASQSKQIYLKPITNNNTYKAINLIIYLNRALTTGDSLTVEVIENGTTTTTLTATSESLNTTKYYERVFAAATSNIEVIITATAGSTGALQITQVLGGVDNEV